MCATIKFVLLGRVEEQFRINCHVMNSSIADS